MQELSLNKWRNINYRIPRHTWLYFEYFFVSGIMHLGEDVCLCCRFYLSVSTPSKRKGLLDNGKGGLTTKFL